MLEVMALEVLRYVAASFHINPFCYTMADEIAYLPNYDMPPMGGQQFEFIGVQWGDTIDAATVTITIRDVFQHMNLQITKARG